MIGYVTIGVRDMEKAKSFYTQLLAPLGAKELMSMDRIAFIGKAMNEPMLAVCIPYDEKDPSPGNGNMVAINPGSKDPVSASPICFTAPMSVTRTATSSAFSSSADNQTTSA